jgi:glycosyltransferase involved in cell wall biosynthesis
MKIAYLADEVPDLRGSTRYQRARYLYENYELFLFLREGAQVPAGMQAGVTITRSGCSSVPQHILWRIFKTFTMGRKLRLDCIYTFYSPFSIIEGFILHLLGFRWVADIWEHPDQILETEMHSVWYKLVANVAAFLARRFLKHADLVICGIMAEALQAYNIAPEKMLEVTNGVDIDYVKQAASEGSGSEELQVFYVGPVALGRSVDVLLKAICEVGRETPVKLTVAGRIYDNFKEWLDDFIAEHDLAEVVKVLGQIDPAEVMRLMAESDICVCPLADNKMRRCAYPIKVLQSLAMGKPTVATDLPGVASIIKHDENGLLVPPNDPGAMARAIIRIREDEGLRKKFETNARASVLPYDWSLINAKIDEALARLATSS